MKERLFIYGTLLPEYASDEIAGSVKRLVCVGEASVSGRLYDLGEYPGAVLDPSAKTKVFGRVYELPNNTSTLRALDSYEEFYPNDLDKSLFVRKQILVNLSSGERVPCWVYVYNRDPGAAPLLTDGNYKKYQAA
jgi:gamma-glutamylcyclotransferase (GGCT)/AIG2-like uncharacterized protein YtfP